MNKCLNLFHESGYNDNKKYYEKNKHKVWHEWLEVEEIFSNSGKQGLVGIFKVKGTDVRYVFKLSQYINYLVQHELTIMKALNSIGEYCPHFCKSIGGILADIEPKIRKNGNPFKITSKYPVEKEILLLEHIPKSTKFYNYIRSKKIPDEILYSTVKQTLLAVLIAQKKKQFTHYDLHSNNVMMRKCNKDLVFLYIIDDKNQYCVPTYGKYPVIIDFGFSYANTIDNGPLWPSMGFTNIGFTSNKYDSVADSKLFLVTVSDEIHLKRKNKKSKKFLNIVKNIFRPLNMDWDCGWDDDDEFSASDNVLELLKGYENNSELFDKYSHYCIDLLQSLVIAPLQEQNYSDIDRSFVTFVKEFVKIEKEVGNPFYCLYILKGVVDIARDIRSDYLNKETRQKAVKYFSKAVYEYIDLFTKYAKPKNIHFEKMLCSLLCLARNIEGVLYDTMFIINKNKEKQYNKLQLQTIEQIYAAIEINIPDSYEFNENTTIMVMDCVKEICYEKQLTEEQIQAINETEPICRGIELHSLIEK